MKIINAKNQYKKGEMIVNTIGWAGIVVEGTRGNDPMIVNMVEVFGFEHESGSMYTNEVARRIGRSEFEMLVKAQGHAIGDYYFKGELLEPVQ